MNKFNEGDIVLYRNGERYELGEVKQVIDYEHTFNKHQRQDGPFGEREASGEEVTEIRYKYRVWYHEGDTSALTDENLLISIKNIHAFEVVRKKAE